MNGTNKWKAKKKEKEIKEKNNTKEAKDIQWWKRKDDNTKRKRNKYNIYNKMKKIRNKIIHFLLLFINKLIKLLFTKKQIND